jgi:hypothetical protein
MPAVNIDCPIHLFDLRNKFSANWHKNSAFKIAAFSCLILVGMNKWKNIIKLLKTMPPRDHFLYWGFPIILSLLLMICYFRGPNWLQELAASSYNREFGLVENAQNAILLCTIYLAFRLLKISDYKWPKIFYLLIFFAVVFTFLEEIDYGFHYINYLNDADARQRGINHNIHNLPDVNNQIRLIFYILIAIFVIILPYISSSRLPSLLVHFVADIRLQLTVLAFLVISKMAGIFNDLSHYTNLALDGNISEFEELPLYYLLMVYVYKLYKQEWKN